MSRSQRGFTLLELMLVLVIIAVSSSIVMLSYSPSDSRQKTASRTAEQLNSMVEFCADSAAFEGKPLGMMLSARGWQVMQPVVAENGNRHWAPMSGNSRLPLAGEWDPAIEINTRPFRLDEGKTPQIIILPDGQITPFSLSIRSQETRQQLATLSSAGTFPLHLQLAGKEHP